MTRDTTRALARHLRHAAHHLRCIVRLTGLDYATRALSADAYSSVARAQRERMATAAATQTARARR